PRALPLAGPARSDGTLRLRRAPWQRLSDRGEGRGVLIGDPAVLDADPEAREERRDIGLEGLAAHPRVEAREDPRAGRAVRGGEELLEIPRDVHVAARVHHARERVAQR